MRVLGMVKLIFHHCCNLLLSAGILISFPRVFMRFCISWYALLGLLMPLTNSITQAIDDKYFENHFMYLMMSCIKRFGNSS